MRHMHVGCILMNYNYLMVWNEKTADLNVLRAKSYISVELI